MPCVYLLCSPARDFRANSLSFPFSMHPSISTSREWLETDGLGGFASGTLAGLRTRRYHALLLTGQNGPSGRQVLVNGCDAIVATTAGEYAISAQQYLPDVVHPDGANRVHDFT